MRDAYLAILILIGCIVFVIGGSLAGFISLVGAADIDASLRRALSEYVEHFHAERNHQGGQWGVVPVKDARDHCGRDDCVAGVGGLELWNPSASHVFEMT
jgi:hypothetical protein